MSSLLQKMHMTFSNRDFVYGPRVLKLQLKSDQLKPHPAGF